MCSLLRAAGVTAGEQYQTHSQVHLLRQLIWDEVPCLVDLWVHWKGLLTIAMNILVCHCCIRCNWGNWGSMFAVGLHRTHNRQGSLLISASESVQDGMQQGSNYTAEFKLLYQECTGSPLSW